MEILAKVAKYVFTNRRVIGLIVGSTLTLAGLPDVGDFITRLGES